MKTNIICGFAGIGKSHLAKHSVGVVDLESTPFQKDWDTYTRVADHMATNGYIVLMSCHKELRDKLKEKNIDYWVAIPRKENKEDYLKRYLNRGSTKEFIEMMESNFDKFIDEIESEEKNIIYIDKFLPTQESIKELPISQSINKIKGK